jgi:hypothetical protein
MGDSQIDPSPPQRRKISLTERVKSTSPGMWKEPTPGVTEPLRASTVSPGGGPAAGSQPLLIVTGGGSGAAWWRGSSSRERAGELPENSLITGRTVQALLDSGKSPAWPQ